MDKVIYDAPNGRIEIERTYLDFSIVFNVTATVNGETTSFSFTALDLKQERAHYNETTDDTARRFVMRRIQEVGRQKHLR